MSVLYNQENHPRMELVYCTSCGQEEGTEGSDSEKTMSGWSLDFFWHMNYLEWKQILLQWWFVSSVETLST